MHACTCVRARAHSQEGGDRQRERKREEKGEREEKREKRERSEREKGERHRGTEIKTQIAS